MDDNSRNYLWALALFRPWALAPDQYNTLDVIKSNLEDWAKANAYNTKILKRIKRQYPEAENALAKYYRVHFKLDVSVSKKMAARAIAILFSNYYVFHVESRNSSRNFFF
jgi:hypothetical protein